MSEAWSKGLFWIDILFRLSAEDVSKFSAPKSSDGLPRRVSKFSAQNPPIKFARRVSKYKTPKPPMSLPRAEERRYFWHWSLLRELYIPKNFGNPDGVWPSSRPNFASQRIGIDEQTQPTCLSSKKAAAGVCRGVRRKLDRSAHEAQCCQSALGRSGARRVRRTVGVIDTLETSRFIVSPKCAHLFPHPQTSI